jgi:hypothetical protein
MRADKEAKIKWALELDAAGLDKMELAERLGYLKSALRDLLKRSKRRWIGGVARGPPRHRLGFARLFHRTAVMCRDRREKYRA